MLGFASRRMADTTSSRRLLTSKAEKWHPDRAVSDVWANVAELDPAIQQRLAEVLETRGADAQQQSLREAFLGDVEFPARGARARGRVRDRCSHPSHRRIAGRRVGGRGRYRSVLAGQSSELAADLGNVTFEEADAVPSRSTTEPSTSSCSTRPSVTSLAPSVRSREAFRVLRPSGQLRCFDGDYATTTVALGDHDPVQACVDAMVSSSVTDRWLVRRLPAIVRRCGFELTSFRSHGFVETEQSDYMLTIVDRGADLLRSREEISDETAAALKAEARRRVRAGTFFGHIAYASVIGRK